MRKRLRDFKVHRHKEKFNLKKSRDIGRQRMKKEERNGVHRPEPHQEPHQEHRLQHLLEHKMVYHQEHRLWLAQRVLHAIIRRSLISLRHLQLRKVKIVFSQ